MPKPWRYSHVLFLRINYGKMTYRKMQEWMKEKHSEKAISNMAVKIGISNKRNWSDEEVNILKTIKTSEAAKLIGRSLNACKIKKSRLCIR